MLDTVTIDDLFDIAEEQQGRSDERVVTPAVPWMCEHFIDPISKRHIRLERYQRRILRHALQLDADGRGRYSLVIWSQTKKSGKTAIAGGVGAWVADQLETPNEVCCVANDQEQSSVRIFAAMLPTLDSLGWKVPDTPRGTFAYNPSTGSVVKAITTRYEGAAGGNQGISLWSELWAYRGERLNRLWEEMTPPPTRKFSMRWVETYAGFKQESLLLHGLYRKIFHTDETEDREPELNDGVVKLWDDLPVYELADEGMLVFWDHDHRMPWQTPEYYRVQCAQLRSNAFRRLHGNYWIDSSEQFISEEMWNASCRRNGPMKVEATYALDAAKNDDAIALVGCVKVGDVVHVTDVHIWESKDGSEHDYNEVMNVVLELKENGLLQPPLWYDPYQLVKMAQDLRLEGVDCKEFSQGADRIKADTSLYKNFKNGSIVTWNHPVLRRHVLAATAVFQGKDAEDCRIVKPALSTPTRSAMKVDGCVALSMAAHKAYHLRPRSGWTLSGI